jgi:hypothetical protein
VSASPERRLAAGAPSPAADAVVAPAPPSAPGAAPGGDSPLRSALSVLTTLGPPLTIATSTWAWT